MRSYSDNGDEFAWAPENAVSMGGLVIIIFLHCSNEKHYDDDDAYGRSSFPLILNLFLYIIGDLKYGHSTYHLLPHTKNLPHPFAI